MNYSIDILNRLLDIYERREAFNKEASSLRAIQLDIKKTYPSYADRYNHEVYKEINIAVDKLVMEKYIVAESNSIGQYTKVKLNVEQVQQVYKKLKRTSIPVLCEKGIKILDTFTNIELTNNSESVIHNDLALLQLVINDWRELLTQYKKLPYDLKYDYKRMEEVLHIIQAILKLNKETYIRNFSTALFKDSKKFQKEYRGCIEGILFDYTEEVVEKNKILEYYNLYENPTYVLIKGDVQIRFDTSVINVSEIPDGIALSNASLDNIKSITVNVNKVITVENLTTYHDSDEENAIHIYLGGYHNSSKQRLLERIYVDNNNCEYYHKGDLDVYGFLILENLIEKTKIPFKPLMMDVTTLKKYYNAGIYKELTSRDVKVIKEQKDIMLSKYSNVLEFMLDNNCKVEQESIKAGKLFFT